MQVQPYIHFAGRCGEAIEFYRRAVGAEVETVMRFKDMPPGTPTMGPAQPPENVMHASLRVGDTTFMASDGTCAEQAGFKGFSLSLNVPDAATAERVFKALSDGGKVTMPLMKTFFSPSFGMTTDRFGVPWMVHVPSSR